MRGGGGRLKFAFEPRENRITGYGNEKRTINPSASSECDVLINFRTPHGSATVRIRFFSPPLDTRAVTTPRLASRSVAALAEDHVERARFKRARRCRGVERLKPDPHSLVHARSSVTLGNGRPSGVARGVPGERAKACPGRTAEVLRRVYGAPSHLIL